eukprot:2964740-Alexandrium_andersonii.AAC.1
MLTPTIAQCQLRRLLWRTMTPTSSTSATFRISTSRTTALLASEDAQAPRGACDGDSHAPPAAASS